MGNFSMEFPIAGPKSQIFSQTTSKVQVFRVFVKLSDQTEQLGTKNTQIGPTVWSALMTELGSLLSRCVMKQLLDIFDCFVMFPSW